MVAVLFNRRCEALFSGQLYIEPREGVPAFLDAGGTLRGSPVCGEDVVAEGGDPVPCRSDVVRPPQRASRD